MSDVIAQDQLFSDPRLGIAVANAPWNVREVLGALLLIWHDSQALGVTEATAEQIAGWARIDVRRGAHRRYVEAMCAASFLLRQESGSYLIVGNAWRIAVRQKRSNSGRKGADAKWGKGEGHDGKRIDLPSECHRQNDGKSMQSQSQSQSQSNSIHDDSHESPRPEATSSPRDLAELWNANKAFEQPAVNLKLFKPGTKRWKQAQARLRENPDPDFWKGVIDRIALSSFLKGLVERRDGGSPWVAGFDWFVRPDTAALVLEGKYDDRIPLRVVSGAPYRPQGNPDIPIVSEED